MQAPRAIRVGVVGAGLSATTFHAPFIVAHPSLVLTKFLRSSSTNPVSGFQDLPVCTDLQQFLLEPPDIDLVVITTPTNTHARIAKACLEADKHVVLEKPMCATADEARELCRLARQHNKLLAVYQNRRWDGDFQTVAALVKAGALGRVVEYESHFDRFRASVKPGWKEDGEVAGSGILFDLGSHLVDQALTLFGHPTAITAHILNQRQLPATSVPDAFTITLHYSTPSGPLTAILRASMLTKTPGPRFCVHGTLGSFTKQGMDVQEGQLRAGMSPLEPGFGVEGPGLSGVLDSLALDLQTLSWTSGLPEYEGTDKSGRAAAGGSAGGAAGAGAGDAGGADAGGGDACKVTALNTPAVADVLGLPVVDVATIAAAVLARKDASGTTTAGAAAAASTAGGGEGSGSRVRVVTETGRWMEFYNDVVKVLLPGDYSSGTTPLPAAAAAAAGGGAAPAETSTVHAAAAVLNAVGTTTAAAAPVGGIGTGSSGSSSSSSEGGGVNSQLSVQPEQAAAVIELLQLAMQSSKEGRTISLGGC